MQLLWASMVPKDLDLGTKAVGQVQKVEQGAKPKLVAARKTAMVVGTRRWDKRKSSREGQR